VPEPGYPVPRDVSLLPVLRALAECYQAVERVASREIEAMGLTPSQFDVLATLGDEPGMSCKALAERALISSPTLTPVMKRLEARGLLQRQRDPDDSRQLIVSLTEAGQALYEETFLPYVRRVKPRLAVLDPQEEAQLIALLNKLKGAMGAQAP
jgi:DNA-binding MarR family transcriptional regulator